MNIDLLDSRRHLLRKSIEAVGVLVEKLNIPGITENSRADCILRKRYRIYVRVVWLISPLDINRLSDSRGIDGTVKR